MPNILLTPVILPSSLICCKIDSSIDKPLVEATSSTEPPSINFFKFGTLSCARALSGFKPAFVQKSLDAPLNIRAKVSEEIPLVILFLILSNS